MKIPEGGLCNSSAATKAQKITGDALNYVLFFQLSFAMQEKDELVTIPSIYRHVTSEC